MSLLASVLRIPEAGEADPFRDMRKEIHEHVHEKTYLRFFNDDNDHQKSFLQKLLWRDVIFLWKEERYWRKIVCCPYLNGKLHGVCKEYRRIDETLFGHSNYERGKRHGESREYYEDGKTLRKHSNYENGKEHGEYKVFRKDGKLWRRGNFKNGNEDGVHELYYKEGPLRERCTYLNGKLYALLQGRNS